MSEVQEHPAFEFRRPDGHTFKVWASGRTEGFGGEGIVINRIPILITEASRRAHKVDADSLGSFLDRVGLEG